VRPKSKSFLRPKTTEKGRIWKEGGSGKYQRSLPPLCEWQPNEFTESPGITFRLVTTNFLFGHKMTERG